MGSPLGSLMVMETGLAILFLLAVINLWRKVGVVDALLWGMVWCTRVFAAVKGAGHLQADSEDLFIYMALQGCSGVALIAILMRGEIRIVKERVLRRLTLRLTSPDPRSPQIGA